MANYQYQRLRPNEIRLLKLTSPNPVRYQLSNVELLSTSAPKYVALSYTWGDVEPCLPLLLENGQILITPNLKNTLRQLRDDHDGDFLWIDAVCINQNPVNDEEKAEKNGQIRLMTNTYEKAAQVYVWLGIPQDQECNDLARRQFEYLEPLYLEEVQRISNRRPWWTPQQPQPEARQTTPIYSLLRKISKNDNRILNSPDSGAHKAWKGIAELFDSRWWTRTWVYQEATISEDSDLQMFTFFFVTLKIEVPPSKVVFRYGSCTATWRHLKIANSVDMRFVADKFEPYWSVQRVRSVRQVEKPTDLLDLLSYAAYQPGLYQEDI